jgi:hypothetical protein
VLDTVRIQQVCCSLRSKCFKTFIRYWMTVQCAVTRVQYTYLYVQTDTLSTGRCFNTCSNTCSIYACRTTITCRSVDKRPSQAMLTGLVLGWPLTMIFSSKTEASISSHTESSQIESDYRFDTYVLSTCRYLIVGRVELKRQRLAEGLGKDVWIQTSLAPTNAKIITNHICARSIHVCI